MVPTATWSPVVSRRGAPDDRAQPGDEFVHVEGFGDVVDRAEIEGGDLVLAAAAGGQHDDRQLGSVVAQLADDVESVEVWQAEIKYEQVGRLPANLRRARESRWPPWRRRSRGR